MRRVMLAVLALTVTLLILTGCSKEESTVLDGGGILAPAGDDPTGLQDPGIPFPPGSPWAARAREPVVTLDVTPDSAETEITQTLSVVALVGGGGSGRVAWYVNDVLGGGSNTGFITQANPAVFTAPDAIPIPATVVVKAVSRDDPSISDTCLVRIAFTTVHVHRTRGDDVTGCGGLGKPFRSITRGLEVATAGMVVKAAAGTYDAVGGEVFPLRIGDSVSVVGMGAESTVIRGHAESAYNSSVVFAGTASALRKFTIRRTSDAASVPKISLFIDSICEDALVDSVVFADRADYANLRISGARNTTIQNCSFEFDDGLEQGRGIEAVFGDRGTIIRACTFSGFWQALYFNRGSDALVEDCTVESNQVGVWVYGDPDAPSDDGNPDLGGGARGSRGVNVIRSNSGCGLLNTSANAIYAIYNTWANDPPIEGIDYCNESTGSVVVD